MARLELECRAGDREAMTPQWRSGSKVLVGSPRASLTQPQWICHHGVLRAISLECPLPDKGHRKVTLRKWPESWLPAGNQPRLSL